MRPYLLVKPCCAYLVVRTTDQDFLSPPAINDIKNNTTKMKNKILAIDAAPAAIPKNPNIPAMMAIIKKITVQRNIMSILMVIK